MHASPHGHSERSEEPLVPRATDGRFFATLRMTKTRRRSSPFIRHPSSFASDSAPIIGVTGPDEGGGAAWWFTRFAVWLAGGHAVRITPRHPRKIDGLDGLILGGGADVDPQLYG